jgi:integrase/recombinase XerD
LPARRQRVAPYIYSPAEIAALMQAAGTLTPPLRAAAFRTVIGLMATTGLRLGEALWLDRADVDLTDGALHVRARQHKQREVPIHPTTTRALRDYACLRDRRWPRPQSPAFFLNTRGGRLSKPEFNHWFAKLIGRIGLEGAGERMRPRPHDLRHAMAVRTLLDWIAAGEDVDRRMPELSTFLGHADPASTYWYLEAVPELMALISRRLQRVPEVLP